MFESVTIRRHRETGSAFGLGTIAEALLFYQNVHLVFTHIDLFTLIKRIGLAQFLNILNRPSVKATYLANLTLTTKTMEDREPVYRFGLGRLLNGRGEPSSPGSVMEAMLLQSPRPSRKERRIAKKVIEKIEVWDMAADDGRENDRDVIWQATGDLASDDYVQKVAFRTLEALIPNIKLPQGCYFRSIVDRRGFRIDTNLNFRDLNQQYAQIPLLKRQIKDYRLNTSTGETQVGENVDAISLLSPIMEIRLNIVLSLYYLSEIMTVPSEADVMQLRFSQVVQRGEKSKQELALFNNVVFERAPSIAETLDSGKRALSDFFRVLDEAARFKIWIQGIHPDRSVAAEYLKSISAVDWLDRLPPKTVRFALFTGAGLLTDAVLPTGIGTAAGLALGAGDAFLLDKLVKGWRPSQFIDGPIKEFLEADGLS